MKKLLLIITIAIFGIVSWGESKTETKKDEKKLIVGTNGVFPPFEYMENGELVGFDIDLIKQIGKNLGYEIEMKSQPFDALIPSLKAGKLDAIISGITVTEARKRLVDFTDEYFNSTQVYLRKKGNIAVNSKESLSGKKVGVQLGTIQEFEANKIKNVNVITNDATVNIILDLKNGKTDAVILENIVAMEFMKKNPDIEIFYEEKLPYGMAIAFDKGKHSELIKKINEELKKLQENGQYSELMRKYGLEMKKLKIKK